MTSLISFLYLFSAKINVTAVNDTLLVSKHKNFMNWDIRPRSIKPTEIISNNLLGGKYRTLYLLFVRQTVSNFKTTEVSLAEMK